MNIECCFWFCVLLWVLLPLALSNYLKPLIQNLMYRPKIHFIVDISFELRSKIPTVDKYKRFNPGILFDPLYRVRVIHEEGAILRILFGMTKCEKYLLEHIAESAFFCLSVF